MGFEIPKYIQDYLSVKSKPFESFVNTSTYYANLNPYYINYMSTTVRQCMAYAYGVQDGFINDNASFNIGATIKDAAVRIVKGNKVMFTGSDTASEFLSDVWLTRSGFDLFFDRAIDYLLSGGTTAVKLNINHGRIKPSAYRIDRFYADCDDDGDVTFITFLSSLLSSESHAGGINLQYWLAEQRYYNRNGEKCIIFKVMSKGGVAGTEAIPSVEDAGIPFFDLPDEIQSILRRKNIRINEEMVLPFNDGLGVWLWRRTASNSCVPGAPFGDPLLFGVEDILWAIDTVFGGSLVDVLNGKGKILVPKRFMRSLRSALQGTDNKAPVWMNGDVLSNEYDDEDESLVYLLTEHDKDFTPQSVQFEIRSAAFKEMFEVYIRQACVKCGFAPTSIFPFLQDNSPRTATEVRSEDNLTQATVQSLHRLIVPLIDRMITEVLRFYSFTGHANVQLSDYIGNKLQYDQNLRENYAAGAMPLDVFVQKINGISKRETDEYVRKILEEQKEKQAQPFGGLGGFDIGV